MTVIKRGNHQYSLVYCWNWNVKSKTVSRIYRMTAPSGIIGRSPFNQVWENSSRPLRITSVSNAVPRASSGVPWRKCPTGLGCARVNRRSTLKATCSHNCGSLLSLSLTYHLVTSLTHSSFSNALFNFLLLYFTWHRLVWWRNRGRFTFFINSIYCYKCARNII